MIQFFLFSFPINRYIPIIFIFNRIKQIRTNSVLLNRLQGKPLDCEYTRIIK